MLVLGLTAETFGLCLGLGLKSQVLGLGLGRDVTGLVTARVT